jgi:hypothetical protein
MTDDIPRGFVPLIPTHRAASSSSSKKFIFTVPTGHEHEFSGFNSVVSKFDLGPEKYHTDIFIEYERTFGRSYAANDKQHHAEVGDNAMSHEYRAIALKAVPLMLNATEDEAKEIIEEIREFRRKHPEVYEG